MLRRHPLVHLVGRTDDGALGRLAEHLIEPHRGHPEQVKNNYDVMWKNAEGTEAGMGVFNGDIGRIIQVDNRMELVTVDFEGHIVEYSPAVELTLSLLLVHFYGLLFPARRHRKPEYRLDWRLLCK